MINNTKMFFKLCFCHFGIKQISLKLIISQVSAVTFNRLCTHTGSKLPSQLKSLHRSMINMKRVDPFKCHVTCQTACEFLAAA